MISVELAPEVVAAVRGDGRSILAEQIKTEISDGATPYSTYVRGVIIDGDRGVLLTGGPTAP